MKSLFKKIAKYFIDFIKFAFKIKPNTVEFSGLEETKKILRNMGGKEFTTVFVKRSNGELRKMRCQYGVSKNITGRGMSYDPESRDLSVVFDLDKDSYRMINLPGVISIKQEDVVYINSSRKEEKK